MLLCLAISTKAQLGRFALVKPDGTSFIYSSWDSTYNNAANGDNIYLPGGYVEMNNPINKTLNIYGAGYNQDSSVVTEHTIVRNPAYGTLYLNSGASGGAITGVYFQGGVSINDTVNNYKISRCQVGYINIGNSTGIPPSNIIISESAITGSVQASNTSATYPLNVVIINCFVGTYDNGNNAPTLSANGTWKNLIVRNCILFGKTICNYGCSYFLNNIDYSYFENCIFYFSGGNYTGTNYSTYRNCLLIGRDITSLGSNAVFNCIYNQTIASTFINQTGNTFDIHNDYRLQPTSPGKNVGSDGTDIGIYGGVLPWNEGGVPGNPHIYFKKVAPQTDSNGQLQIQYKVRANN